MAGSKSNAFETSLLTLIFNNTALANIGNAGGLLPSSVAGSFYIALFTTAPSDSSAGTEANYTGYARVAVARTSGGWTISGDTCHNTAAITFAACTAGTNTITSFAIMTASSAGDMLYWGTLTSNLSVSAGIIPEFAAGDLDITED
jgi:hypothetical protein